MSTSPNTCFRCGWPRGDGRKDRGWKYLYVKLRVFERELEVQICSCPGCYKGLELEAEQRGSPIEVVH